MTRRVAATASALLVIDLFLPWQHTAVRVGGMRMGSASTGWTGWGVPAGVCALALLALTLADRAAVTRALLAVGMFVFTTLAAFLGTGDTEMAMYGVAIHVHSTWWPAWIGVALSAVAALATALPLRDGPRRGTDQTHALPHG
jgi:hypothetical protein